MKMLLQIAAMTAAIVAPLGALAAYDRSETTERFTVETTWSGYKAVYRYEDGRLFNDTRGENLGLFASGRPRLVAFDCEGSESVLIALEEDELPRCGRIERISGPDAIRWADEA
jgi:hypothetical protein